MYILLCRSKAKPCICMQTVEFRFVTKILNRNSNHLLKPVLSQQTNPIFIGFKTQMLDLLYMYFKFYYITHQYDLKCLYYVIFPVNSFKHTSKRN